MKKFSGLIYYMPVILLSLVLFGCLDDSDSSKKDNSVHLRMLDAHNTYMAAVDNEITNHIASQLPNAEEQISLRIHQELDKSGHDLSETAFALLAKGIREDYIRESRKAIQAGAGPELGQILREFHETGGMDDPALRDSSLEYTERRQIEENVADRFQWHITGTVGASIDEDILAQVLDKWFPPAGMLLQSDFQPATANVFVAAEDTSDFNTTMKAYFSTYDAENDYNESDHTPVPGHYLYKKIKTTNTFDGKTLRIHEPHFEAGAMKIFDDEKTIDFPDIGTMTPDMVENTFIAVSADTDGNGSRELVIFKQYDDNTVKKYVAFTLGNAPNYFLYRISNIPPFVLVTDVAAGDIDADGRDELIVAGREKQTDIARVILFDDAGQAYHKITEIQCDTSGDQILRVDSGDTNANGYDEIGIVCYPTPDLDGKNVKLLEYDNIDKTINTLMSAKLSENTPADVVFADLESVDKIDMYVVQLDSEKKDTPMGWSQPDQEGSDAECRFYIKSVNTINIYGFPYAFDRAAYGVTRGAVDIVNRTYDRQFNESGKNGADDGVKCFAGGCSCDEDFRAESAYLFYVTKPIYATPYMTAPDEPAMLDVDGFAIKYRPGDTQTIEVAKDYYDGQGHDHTHNDYKHYYIPVRSNQDGHTVVTITQGNHLYANSSYPRMIPAASNTDGNDSETVWRSYHSYGITTEAVPCSSSWITLPCYKSISNGRMKRLSMYANDAMVMEFDHHRVLYSDPQILYVIGAPPPIGDLTRIYYKTGECTKDEHKDQSGNGTIWGVSISIGEEIGGPGGEGGDEEIAAGVEAGTVQSSGNIELHSEEECLSITESTDGGEDDLVGFKAYVTDSYVYKIIKDISNANNVGKYISVEIPRGELSHQKRIAYRDQIYVDDLYANLASQGLSPAIDIKGLINHDWQNADSYLDETVIRDFFDHPGNYLPSGYNYSQFWHPDKSALMPTSGEEELEYSKTIEEGEGDFEHDQYELVGKVMMKLKAGFIAHGFVEGEVSLGHEWSFEHEDLVIDVDETSYVFRADGDGVSRTYNRVGIFSFLAQPEEPVSLGRSLPINRKMLKTLDKEEQYAQTAPVFVIDYWLTDNDNIENP